MHSSNSHVQRACSKPCLRPTSIVWGFSWGISTNTHIPINNVPADEFANWIKSKTIKGAIDERRQLENDGYDYFKVSSMD